MLRTCVAAAGIGLDAAALERIERFVEVLAVWRVTTRLTGERDMRAVVRKHVMDSLAPLPHLPACGRLVDVGVGAGFPGLVLACVRPDLTTILLEARRRRASFLREAVRVIPLPSTTVLEARAEDAARAPGSPAAGATVVTARAIRLDEFLPVAAALLAPGGQAIAMQTPRISPEAATTAGARAGLTLVGVEDYELPGGERRRLLRYAGR